MRVEDYPGILKAALDIAYSNNGINRGRSEEQHQAELQAFLTQEGFKPAFLEAANAWLLSLTPEEMETATDGEDQARCRLLKTAPRGMDDLLETIFNEVC